MRCRKCKSQFEISSEDRNFYDNVSPVITGKKYPIPEPTFCPDCRQQRRLAMCNEMNLYPGVCGMCKKRMLTEHPPFAKQPNYCRDCWVSDKWDTIDYGREFDFSKSFFEQFYELQRVVPLMNLGLSGEIQNSDYVHYTGHAKNCYLIAHADFCEDCMYGYGFKENKSCVDGFYNLHNELCYDCVDCHKSYGLKGCQDCQNCHSSSFLRDCIGCKNCFLCVGQREKEYCFKNEQLSKKEYEAKMTEINLGSHEHYQKYKSERKEIEKDHTFKEFQGHNLQNSVGNYLYNCKDCYKCFDCEDVEGAKYCTQLVLGSKNIMDIYQYGTGLQMSYDSSIAGDHSYNILFSHQVFINCSDMIYCAQAHSSRKCFGSTGLMQNKYCILNKQYSEEEYNKMVPKIIEHMKKTGEWGEFFNSKYSLFGYNKTTAQLYYPLEKEEALKQGFKWDDYDPPPPKVDKTIPAGRLPDNIKDTPDDILNWAIECEKTSKPFKITDLELKFYRKQNLPIPRRHPDQRHIERFKKRNPRKFWDRKCDNCQIDIKTTHSPDREELVYCEDCYLKEVY